MAHAVTHTMGTILVLADPVDVKLANAPGIGVAVIQP